MFDNTEDGNRHFLFHVQLRFPNSHNRLLELESQDKYTVSLVNYSSPYHPVHGQPGPALAKLASLLTC